MKARLGISSNMMERHLLKLHMNKFTLAKTSTALTIASILFQNDSQRFLVSVLFQNT